MNLKIFKVYASKEVKEQWRGNWWDEYFGHVVIAEDEKEAIEIAYHEGLLVPKELASIKEIVPLEKGIVLSDFNAG